jgi:HK97 family phage prohead protease
MMKLNDMLHLERLGLIPVLGGGDPAATLEPPTLTDAAQRTRFYTDVPFTKAYTGKSGDLELTGYASTWVEDRDGEFVHPQAFDRSLDDYLAKNPQVLWQHNMDWPLGSVVEARVDANGLAVRAIVRKPVEGEEPWKISAYHDIKAGIVRTFSIGGYMMRDYQGGRIVILDVELLEISVVSIPANPDSIFEAAVKAIKGGHRPTLPQKAIDQMQQLLGMRHMTDPELLEIVKRGDAAMEARYLELAKLYEKAGKLAPGRAIFEEAKQVADPRERLASVLDVMALANGDVEDTKAGRVLSKANETAIRKAAEAVVAAGEALQTVLAKVQADSDEADDPGKQAGADADDDGRVLETR